MAGLVCAVFPIIWMVVIFKIIKTVLNNNASNEQTAQISTPQVLSQTEQEAIKARIRERVGHAPDPHRMPKEYHEPTPQEVNAYHDVLDECHTDGCDVNPGETQAIQPVVQAQAKKASSRKRNAIIQMMLADSVLHRRDF